MIRIGLVGAGPWTGMFHAPMLAAAPDIELSGIWARRPEAAQALAREYASLAVPSFEDLLRGCDAVAFSVPPDVQAHYAPLAARAGKHLLLEKPLAFTAAAAQAIADAADAAGVTTQLMLTYRFTPQVRDFLAAAGAATVRHARLGWITSAALPGSPFATPWRKRPGAALFDVGPHALDLLDAALGPATELFAAQSGGVTSITSRHADGAVGQVALSLTTPGATGPVEAVAVTDSGILVLADPTPVRPQEVQSLIADDFVRTVRGETEQSLDVHRGVDVQRLIEAATVSIDTGQPVRLDQIPRPRPAR